MSESLLTELATALDDAQQSWRNGPDAAFHALQRRVAADRRVLARHVRSEFPDDLDAHYCLHDHESWPCPDLLDLAARYGVGAGGMDGTKPVEWSCKTCGSDRQQGERALAEHLRDAHPGWREVVAISPQDAP